MVLWSIRGCRLLAVNDKKKPDLHFIWDGWRCWRLFVTKVGDPIWSQILLRMDWCENVSYEIHPHNITLLFESCSFGSLKIKSLSKKIQRGVDKSKVFYWSDWVWANVSSPLNKRWKLYIMLIPISKCLKIYCVNTFSL